MDFLDNAVNKAKEVFDVACKKTNEVVTTQKQKFDIATIVNKRNKDFEALGKLYFEAVKESEIEDKEISNLVAKIKEKNELIKQINEEMGANKNMKVCPKCNAFVKDDAQFCSSCGEKLEKEN